MPHKAIVAGASGLVGNELLHILLESSAYEEVLVLVRKELPVNHKKLVQLVIDFNQLENYQSAIRGYAVFCCLGTTRKKTPDLKVYHQIDVEYPIKLAQLAAGNQIQQYHLLSSMGADTNSWAFYTRMKGEVEQGVEQSGMKCVHIYRPSLLVGQRKEPRVAERIITAIMKVLDPILWGSLKKYRSIAAHTVAMAMYKQSLQKQEGVFVHLSDHIKQLA